MLRLYHRILLVSLLTVFSTFSFIAHADHAININTASIEALDTLPGVGPTTAQYIVDGRPYASVQEISTVKGIGEPGSKTYDDIIGHITVGGGISEPPPEETETEEEVITPETSSGGGVFIPDSKTISVDAGENRTVFVGADSLFSVVPIGATGEPLENARVVWSFGNGDRKEGERVLYHYLYPGTYTVVVDVVSGKYNATDRVMVTARPATVTVTEVTNDYIALKNDSGVEVNIGGWILFSVGRQFQFPLNTVIQEDQEVFVSNKRTGLSGQASETVALQYPNGMVAASYKYPLFVSSVGGRVSLLASEQPQAAVEGPSGAGEEKPEPLESGLVAAPILAHPLENDSEKGIMVWVLGLFVLLIGSAAGVFFIRNRASLGERGHKTNDYTIKEID